MQVAQFHGLLSRVAAIFLTYNLFYLGLLFEDKAQLFILLGRNYRLANSHLLPATPRTDSTQFHLRPAKLLCSFAA